ncbi:MAG: radical SAM protein [Desulfatibacillaceae bacterium]|nr:radical SAM protein [Desulfatibacillaceae bacterium]
MRYEGPIYRPPSEADSLLVQATVGCPHNRCTFCMVYKDGPRYKVRPVDEIIEDLCEAASIYGEKVSTLFFPAGNTIAMKTADLAQICKKAGELFPNLARITVYGSIQYIFQKGPAKLKTLREAGLCRIHAGLESGDDAILRQVKKGFDSKTAITAGQWAIEAGIELSLYVVLGLGGREQTRQHGQHTADVLNHINPHFIRLRTFVPKINTPMLQDVKAGRFLMLSPHEVLEETRLMIENLDVTSQITSDHYTNYINLEGRLPPDKASLLADIEKALQRPQSDFRPFFIGDQ